MRLRNQRKVNRADARMDSGEVMIQVDGRFCQQDASGTWRDISTGEGCRAFGAAWARPFTKLPLEELSGMAENVSR